jgi:hypothetical protein
LSHTPAQVRWSDTYLLILSGLLAGYALLGRGFAYLGAPPLFVGEMVFAAGILTFIRTACFIASVTTLPSVLLAVTMAWVLARTLPFFGTYQFDALRDSVVVLYGGFAFIVIALLLEDSRRAGLLLNYYRRFAEVYVRLAPWIFGAAWYFSDLLPTVPGTRAAAFFGVRTAEVSVHLTGAAVFAMAGFLRPTPVWIISLLVGLIMTAAVSRGSILAELVPLVFAAVMLRKFRQMVLVSLIGISAFMLAYAVEPLFFEYSEARGTESLFDRLSC